MTANAIAEYVPTLRRYARALSGSQASGDAYVTETLEAVIQDPSVLEGQRSLRVALFKAFTKVWNSVELNTAGYDAAAPERHLSGITPLPRQAFLLVAVEGFGEDDAAAILDVDVSDLRSLVDESGREMASEIATDVLIIEDEPMIAEELEGLVEELGHSVVGIARTRTEAVTVATEKRPGLILADIRLADQSSGIDAVNDLLQDFQVPVIFITAYPERYLTGDRPEPTFLVTKPYQPATVSALVSQALFFQRNAKTKRAIEA